MLLLFEPHREAVTCSSLEGLDEGILTGNHQKHLLSPVGREPGLRREPENI